MPNAAGQTSFGSLSIYTYGDLFDTNIDAYDTNVNVKGRLIDFSPDIVINPSTNHNLNFSPHFGGTVEQL